MDVTNNGAFVDELKAAAAQFSDQELLDAATLANEAYKRNFCQLYTEEDFLEEFVDSLVMTLNHLPADLSQAIKEKILSL